MTDLKFRAWTGKQMVYQEDQYLGSFIRRAVAQIIQDNSEELTAQDHESYLPNGGNIEEYLTQFSGKQDSNGVDIYIGDIVKAVAHEEYADDSVVSDIIKAEEDSMQIQVRAREGGEVWGHGLGIDWGGWKSIRVIGNIYENPELLEAKK